MKLKRKLTGGENGVDVKMIQRALAKIEDHFYVHGATGYYGQGTQESVDVFQRLRSLSRGDFDQATLDALEPYFDAYGRWRYTTSRVPPVVTPEDRIFARLVSAMKMLDANSQGYRLGASHGVPLEECDANDFYDCSSSTSKVLHEAGIFASRYAIVSGRFDEWGVPGTGKRFTVYYNSEHVWVRLYKTRWWRFDTSPHVDGRPSENPRRGPRLRFFPRFSSSFAPRHYPGL